MSAFLLCYKGLGIISSRVLADRTKVAEKSSRSMKFKMYLYLLTVLSSLYMIGVDASCSPDNCLRALSKVPASVLAFCLTYTTQVVTATAGFPAFLANCRASSSRISSACSCIAPAVTSSVSVSCTSSTISSTSSLASSTTSSSPSTCPSLLADTSTVTLAITSYLYFTSTAVETDDSFYTSTAIETDVESITLPATTITITQNVTLPASTITSTAIETDDLYFTSTAIETDVESITLPPSTVTITQDVTLSASTITSTALYCNGSIVPFPYNRIANPGFESGIENWNCVISGACHLITCPVHSGTYAL